MRLTHIIMAKVGLALAGTVPLLGQQLAQEELGWPPPPEPARIRYVGSLTSEEDLGRSESFLSKLGRAIVGGDGPQNLRVERPFDVQAVDGKRVYLTNGRAPAVFMFDSEQRKARTLGEDVPGGLAKPMGLGVDAYGRIYVADRSLRRVVVFDSAGAFERMFGTADELLNPVDVAVDIEAGRFYVVDSYQHQVLVFDGSGDVIDRLGRIESNLAFTDHDVPDAAGDSDEISEHPGGSVEHQTRDLWRNRGSGDGEFRYPVAADVAPDGTLFVSDQLNFRVQVFARDGTFLRAFGGLGAVPGTFTRPKGIAVDNEGHVYVADASFNNVQVFDAEGHLLIAFGGLGHGAGEHWLPLGVAVDRTDNRIYVADRYNNRTQIYEYLPDSPLPDLEQVR